MSYEIQYAQMAVDDLKRFSKFEQTKLIDGIEEHLVTNPTRTSRARIKRMVQPFWSQFRLRVDEFRVYYDVDENRMVSILRILKKGRAQTSEEASHETS